MLLAASLLVALGCGSASTRPDDETSVDGGCEPGELTLDDGSCLPAGIAPDGCGEGLVHDGVACEPVLPAPCPPGTMAIPGEAACHAVGICFGAAWPDVPAGAGAQYVSLAGGANANGTMAAPWPTIGQAINAATAGDTIALAAGSYSEDVVIDGKALHLVGTCADEVRIMGSAVPIATIDVRHASNTSVRALSVSGSANYGIAVTDALDVVIDAVYIHDTRLALSVQDDLGPSAVTLSGSLVEAARLIGVYVVGSQLAIDRSVIRDSQTDTDGSYGRGIEAHFHDTTAVPAALAVSRSWIRGNTGAGVFLWGSSLTLDDSVIEDTLSSPAAGGGSGRGIDTIAFEQLGESNCQTSSMRG
jgi:hypothetical protein